MLDIEQLKKLYFIVKYFTIICDAHNKKAPELAQGEISICKTHSLLTYRNLNQRINTY